MDAQKLQQETNTHILAMQMVAQLLLAYIRMPEQPLAHVRLGYLRLVVMVLLLSKCVTNIHIQATQMRLPHHRLLMQIVVQRREIVALEYLLLGITAGLAFLHLDANTLILGALTLQQQRPAPLNV
jgi:hypothetical protein